MKQVAGTRSVRSTSKVCSRSTRSRLCLRRLARAGLTAFLLRGEVRGSWSGRVRLDGGRAVFTFEAIEFVAQTLGLSLGGAEIGGKGLDQVEQAGDERPGPLVREAAQIKVGQQGRKRVRHHRVLIVYRMERRPAQQASFRCPRYILRGYVNNTYANHAALS